MSTYFPRDTEDSTQPSMKRERSPSYDDMTLTKRLVPAQRADQQTGTLEEGFEDKCTELGVGKTLKKESGAGDGHSNGASPAV